MNRSRAPAAAMVAAWLTMVGLFAAIPAAAGGEPIAP
jgi:hypothetical protein